MKKRLTALASVAGAVAILAAPGSAMAAECNDGTSQERYPAGHPQAGQTTGNDTIHHVAQSNTTIYGAGLDEGNPTGPQLNPGYLGVTGDRGYLEVSGHNEGAGSDVQIDGKANGTPVEGRVAVDAGSQDPHACLAGTTIVP